MKSENTHNKKHLIGILLALGIGLVIAVIIMSVAIYFGYSDAYKIGTDSYIVKIFGLNIYNLIKNNGTYIGTSVGTNMGILCMMCMAVTIVVAEIIVRIRRK